MHRLWSRRRDFAQTVRAARLPGLDRGFSAPFAQDPFFGEARRDFAMRSRSSPEDCRGKIEPHVGFHVVLGNTTAGPIDEPEVELCLGVPLLGGQAERLNV